MYWTCEGQRNCALQCQVVIATYVRTPRFREVGIVCFLCACYPSGLSSLCACMAALHACDAPFSTSPLPSPETLTFPSLLSLTPLHLHPLALTSSFSPPPLHSHSHRCILTPLPSPHSFTVTPSPFTLTPYPHSSTFTHSPSPFHPHLSPSPFHPNPHSFTPPRRMNPCYHWTE